MYGLRGAPDADSAIDLGFDEYRLGFKLKVVPTVRPICTLDNLVTLLPRGICVPFLKVKGARDVSLRVNDCSLELDGVVELCCAGFSRLLSVKVGRKLFIVDL